MVRQAYRSQDAGPVAAVALIGGFTGTQRGMTDAQKRALEDQLVQRGIGKLRHGDCKGGDEEADAIAKNLFVRPLLHPPADPTKRAFCVTPPASIAETKPYRERNQDIVNGCTILFAAPRLDREELRSGTWMTIRYAGRVGRRTVIIWPDGTLLELPTGWKQ